MVARVLGHQRGQSLDKQVERPQDPVAFLAPDGQRAAASAQAGLGWGVVDSVAAKISLKLSLKWPLFSLPKRALRKGPHMAFLRGPGHGRSCGRLRGRCASPQVHGQDSGLWWLSHPVFEVLSHILPMIPPPPTAHVLTLQTQAASEIS